MDTIIPEDSGYIIRDNISFKISFMGHPDKVDLRIICETEKDFSLKKIDILFSCKRMSFHVFGEVKGKRLILKRRIGKKVFSYVLFLKEKPYVGFSFIAVKDLDIKKSFNLSFFDPASMAQRNITVKVVSKEDVKIKDAEYKAYKLRTELLGNPLDIWVDEKGRILKIKAKAFSIIRSDPESAMKNIVASDVYKMIAIETNRKIPDPRKVSYLKVKINQRIIEIRKEKLPENPPYLIPYKDGLREYLLPEFNIESNSELIRKTAERIIQKERDPVKVTKKIVNWVYRNLEKRPTFSFPSALETLKKKVGDCNEHAVLTAALLRAVGIPNRICIGLIYLEGKFFYHAWNMVYLGKWIQVDSTLNQVPVDATHIMLFCGNIADQAKITGKIGRLKIEVVDYSYDKAD